jgi:shikimate dehydrogenase
MTVYSLGLTGWPLGHSLSPRLHRAALASAGLQGDYRLYPVENLPGFKQGLSNLVDRVRGGDLHGLNVTIPYKQQVLDLCDELTPAARTIGAANTIYKQGGKVIGDNTDAGGFMHDLGNHHFVPPPDQAKTALVLGAGGAARAVVYALVVDGWSVTLSSRRLEQAAEVAACLPRYAHLLEALPLNMAIVKIDFRLVVNCTPVGMSPHPEESPWPVDLALPAHAFIYDLVYNPRLTRLVTDARLVGLRAETGLGMLVEQAALAFEIWTGCKADRAAMAGAVAE